LLNGKRYFHQPVLLPEVLDSLAPKPGENFVDATLGAGGYSRAILSKISEAGKVVSIDLDEAAIENARTGKKDKNWIIHHGNFKEIDKIVSKHNLKKVDGIVADIGFSSFQLDQSGRGLSFKKQEPLDMRFNAHGGKEDAKFILNNRDEKQLAKIFRDYGEEKFALRIARKVIKKRQEGLEIKYTNDLYQIIVDSLPKPVKHKADGSARRIFQALRIEVNHELENLKEFLPKAFGLLASGGRLAVVSFHSLEDRIVKQYFAKLIKGCVCPPEFPICRCGRNPQGKLLNKKPITASDAESKLNPRSKSAKLRAIIKL